MPEKPLPYHRWRWYAAGVTLAVSDVLLTACQAAHQPPAGVAQSPLPPKGANTLSVTAAVLRQDLGKLAVKGRAPMTGYSREQFGKDWAVTAGCDTRDRILRRDLMDEMLRSDACTVASGILNDPYTGTKISFTRGATTSSAVQIDHAVALGDAWQTGAQQLSPALRKTFANDPLELVAVDGPSNEQKGDGDAATWLPPNKADRCAYVGRQVLVKQKYDLWVTPAEETAIETILNGCSGQTLSIAD